MRDFEDRRYRVAKRCAFTVEVGERGLTYPSRASIGKRTWFRPLESSERCDADESRQSPTRADGAARFRVRNLGCGVRTGWRTSEHGRERRAGSAVDASGHVPARVALQGR